MATIQFTSVLKRFFPDLQPLSVEGDSVISLLSKLEEHHPGLLNYILDDHNRLRKHVNIFVNGDIILDRNNLEQEISPSSEIYIMQALSGG